VLTISSLCRAFGSQTVFDRANWFVPSGARVGLVGANGSGKSTLLRMIAGLEEPDDGTIVLPKGTTIGYLPQDVVGASGRTVFEEALDAFAAVRALERRCRELEEALAASPADDPEHDQLLAAYARARERWDREGTYDYESQAATVLTGLGFRADDFERDAGELSGGWQMRLALAKLLLRLPSLLLLDEPTNHLDLEARTWLEGFLRSYPGTVVLVAHDRYFLDVTVDHITEVLRGKLTDYATTYTRYLEEKEVKRARALEAYRLQQEEISRIEAFISRFRYQASKAALVQSRVKQLEKIERLPPPEGVTESLHFRFPSCARSARVVLQLSGATKRYGELTVYDGIDLTIERGRKVALVGPNGAGKSTLMRLLAGAEPLTAGARRVGQNVTLCHFAQDQSHAFDPDATVLDELMGAAAYETAPHVRGLLGAFLFSGDSVYKRVKVLSGGERNRLALAKLLVQPSNCLLLDEPTNHLDIAAKEVLLESLQRYTGTLIIVAHDRYILDRLPEEILEVGLGHVTRYLGNYEDYLRYKSAEDARSAAATHPPKAVDSQPSHTPVESDDRAKARRAARAVAAREQIIGETERTIAAKEEELGVLVETINQPEFYETHADPRGVFSRYARLQKEINALYEKLERLERQRAGAEA
jgi:ATP-binding cassette subfamily F protein 3